MPDPSSKPPCPCCTARLGDPTFKRRTTGLDNLCGECIDGDALMEDILSSDAAVKLRFDLTIGQIDALASALMAKSKALVDGVVASAAANTLTWDAIMAPLNDEDTISSVIDSSCTFPSHVATSKELRDAASDADTRISAYNVECEARKDRYEAIVKYAETEEAKALTGERKRCLAKKLLAARRQGLHLEEAVATQVKECNTRLSELGIKFSKNLGEENTTFLLNEAELVGCPADFVRERKQEDGKVKVTLKYPDYIPVMERCSVAATRAKLEAAFNSRCKDANTSILEELISVRHQKALLMGYPTHAAFVTEDRMSKTPEKVAAFLGDLGTKLKPLLQSDLRELEKLKQAEVGAGAEGDGADARIAAYDRSYYQKKLEEGKFSVDHEALKQYFPLEVVTDGLLSIYQELLGLVFTRDESVEKAAWHEDVVAYAVSDRQSEEAVGIFYMDLHPREGKYGHAACFGLQPACVDHRGKWQQPVAAAVCNFPKPTAEKPALLSHGDVETFFHEFGHVMHQICSKAAICMFAGTRVERDFVEAPSQMLENWCWQPAALKRMSGHHKTRAPIPEELLDALLASRNANSGLLNMRQITLASFDQAIHTVDRADTAEVLAKLSDDLMTIPTTKGTNMGATFGHMGGGYDAQYYGYMWSDVYAMDMFASRFEKEGIFSPETGMSYRKEILSVGGSRDALDSLVAFLGREPIPEPFLVSKGLAA